MRAEVVVVPRTLRESTEDTDWDIRDPLHWPTGQRASTWEPSWGEGPAVVNIPGWLIRVGGGEVPLALPAGVPLEDLRPWGEG